MFPLHPTPPRRSSTDMCITFWYTPTAPISGSPRDIPTNGTPRPETSPYAFILLSNRDLELGRPAFDATFHDFEPITVHPYGKSKAPSPAPPPQPADPSDRPGRRIISGRDAADPIGGTWLGMASYDPASPRAHARIGVLTNIHDDSPVPKGTKTRGSLIKDWLKGAPFGKGEGVGPEEETRMYLDGLKDDAVKLAGFNLLLFDIDLSSARLQPDASTETHVRRITARQLTNRYRPHHQTDDASSPAIPAAQSSITTSATTRTLPASPNPAHASTSPLGTFQSAITPLKPRALHLGGMSNSLLEEPFVKVREGIRDFEEIVGREFGTREGWDARREEELVRELFGLMR